MPEPLPFNLKTVQEIAKKHPTPFHLYEEFGIRRTARALKDAFKWAPGYRNYFAVKATPTPAILNLLREEGMGLDCSSLGELVLAQKLGFGGEEIMFTANDVAAEEFAKARELGAVINFDDISHIPFYFNHVEKPPDFAAIRYNPGPGRTGNVIIGSPEEAKFGVTRDQLFEGYGLLKAKGVSRFGLHTMVASNELDPAYFAETARMLFKLVAELAEHGIELELVNLGGGFGIPYRPEDHALDLTKVSEGIHSEFKKHLRAAELPEPKIVLELGRFVTGPHGYLVSKVRHIKRTYKTFIGLEATMADLMRPGMYGAYHHITILGKEEAEPAGKYDVTGSLCENNDKFAIDRKLPEVEVGDVAVIHDAGAHGRSMGFNYNAKLRCGEVLLKQDGSFEQIRRPETLDDYFATIAPFGLEQ